MRISVTLRLNRKISSFFKTHFWCFFRLVYVRKVVSAPQGWFSARMSPATLSKSTVILGNLKDLKPLKDYNLLELTFFLKKLVAQPFYMFVPFLLQFQIRQAGYKKCKQGWLYSPKREKKDWLYLFLWKNSLFCRF